MVVLGAYEVVLTGANAGQAFGISLRSAGLLVIRTDEVSLDIDYLNRLTLYGLPRPSLKLILIGWIIQNRFYRFESINCRLNGSESLV